MGATAQVTARRRPFRTDGDLAAIGSLLRHAWAAEPRFNAWTFARFDIWAQWRLADLELNGDGAWRDDLAVWEDGVERIVAAAFVGEAPGEGVLVLHPSYLSLVPELLAWLEERGAPQVEANESMRDLCALIARRGYAPDDDGWYVPRNKALVAESPVVVPPGFRLETLTPLDAERYLEASHAVFGRGGTLAAYRYLSGARSAAPGCGVIAVDEDGVVASFANVWVDDDLSVAEFEPVGTRPERQRLELGSAVMTEVENRLVRRGVRLATVHSWSTAEGAARLYDKLGYDRVDRQLSWIRR